jgi:hypothetical protein
MIRHHGFGKKGTAVANVGYSVRYYDGRFTPMRRNEVTVPVE